MKALGPAGIEERRREARRLIRDSHVHRVAGFFRSMRRTLTRLAPCRDEQARVFVLTPGQLRDPAPEVLSLISSSSRIGALPQTQKTLVHAA